MFLGHAAHYSDDVYSLACVVHEWLTGAHPYTSRGRQPLPAPAALAAAARPARLPGLTRAQNRALARGLALSRAGRTQTAGELWRSLSVPRRSWSVARIAAAATLLAGSTLLGSAAMPDRALPLLPAALQSPPRAAGQASPAVPADDSRAPSSAAQAGGAPQDEVAATQWLLATAREGNAGAQYSLGVMFQAGRGGLPRSDTAAASWFALAAVQGNAQAQAILGSLYQSGHGVPHSDTEAVRWSVLAAQQGNTEAQARLQAQGLRW
jgi:TPR repeat protein